MTPALPPERLDELEATARHYGSVLMHEDTVRALVAGCRERDQLLASLPESNAMTADKARQLLGEVSRHPDGPHGASHGCVEVQQAFNVVNGLVADNARLAAEVERLTGEIASMHAFMHEYEILEDDDAGMIIRLGGWLSDIVDAIRGKPEPLHRHSTHDAVELVKQVVADRDRLRAALAEAERRTLESVLKFVRNEAANYDNQSALAEGEGLIDVSKRFATRRDAVSAIARKLADRIAAGPTPNGD